MPQDSSRMANAAADPFDDLLNLEEQFYNNGYQQGHQDGITAGRVEGRGFGMEKGFEKFVESSKLASRAIVWANRMNSPTTLSTTTEEETSGNKRSLSPLAKNVRLDKNIKMLYALVEPGTLSTANTDEAVQDFDDRVKRAQGKVKVVERMVGGRETQQPLA